MYFFYKHTVKSCGIIQNMWFGVLSSLSLSLISILAVLDMNFFLYCFSWPVKTFFFITNMSFRVTYQSFLISNLKLNPPTQNSAKWPMIFVINHWLVYDAGWFNRVLTFNSNARFWNLKNIFQWPQHYLSYYKIKCQFSSINVQ